MTGAITMENATSVHSPSGAPSSANQEGAASGPPPAPRTRRGRRPGTAPAAAPRPIAPLAPPPWSSFNEVPPDHNAAATEAALAKRREREEREAALTVEAALIIADGYHWHICKRNNGSGKYRKGQPYLLPDGQHPDLFEKIEC